MADTRLYDILGVSPNANDTEIKKVSWLFFEGWSNLWEILDVSMWFCPFNVAKFSSPTGSWRKSITLTKIRTLATE